MRSRMLPRITLISKLVFSFSHVPMTLTSALIGFFSGSERTGVSKLLPELEAKNQQLRAVLYESVLVGWSNVFLEPNLSPQPVPKCRQIEPNTTER